MKLTTEQRGVLSELWEQAHADCLGPDGFRTTEVAGRYVDLVMDLTRFGQAWVDDYIAHLAVKGAKGEGDAWRKSFGIAVRTPKSKATCRLPSHGVAKRKQADGTVVQMRLPLRELTRDELRAYVRTFEKQRDTMSREIAVLSAALRYLDEHPDQTTGDAFDALGLAA